MSRMGLLLSTWQPVLLTLTMGSTQLTVVHRVGGLTRKRYRRHVGKGRKITQVCASNLHTEHVLGARHIDVRKPEVYSSLCVPIQNLVPNGPGFILGQKILPLIEYLPLLQILVPEDISMLVFLVFRPKEGNQVAARKRMAWLFISLQFGVVICQVTLSTLGLNKYIELNHIWINPKPRILRQIILKDLFQKGTE